MSIALTLAVAAGGLSLSAVTAQAAPGAPVQGPPFPYADCLKATADKGESRAQGKWHCDQLVKKGWVTPPKR
ncbi:hypothetical protein DMA15_32315 [Streptomyces sp. WAC 01529]|uniref:hypothetical protein n=1 Tax=Streptomyces sp. WAC 01529 TaxID=2203205 RepID=UPI000F71A553|nr:hypothetical protein [Streptomyces sp. WAC 01529]AZM56688.1 hypothetical protein DMA15_32315 [Streptomyces sp. WAC 01529]